MESVSYKLKKHLVDSTGTLTASSPLMAIAEVSSGMVDETSLHARIAGATLIYLGFGSIYSRGRDLSQKLFELTTQDKKHLIPLHDAAYTGVYLSMLQPPFYYVVGEHDMSKIAWASLSAICIGIFAGPIMGYSVDTFRDFFNIKASDRLPKRIQNMSPTTKKYAAALLTTTSVASIAPTYYLSK